MTSAVSLTILGCLERGISKLILEYKHLTHFALFTSAAKCCGCQKATGVTDTPRPSSNLFIGGLSCGGLNAPVSNGLLHTLSCAWRARHLRRGAKRKTFKRDWVCECIYTWEHRRQRASCISGKHLHMTAVNSADKLLNSQQGQMCVEEEVSESNLSWSDFMCDR